MAQRKHVKQMTRTEVEAIHSLVRSIPSWVSKSTYVTGRCRERRIARIEVYRAIKYGTVIEAKDDKRILLRDANGVCVVLSIPDRTIITVWYNDPSDQHYTLDLSQYNWKVNLVTYASTL